MSDHLWNYGQRVDSVEHLQELQAVDPEDYSEAAFRLAFRLFILDGTRSWQSFWVLASLGNRVRPLRYYSLS